MADPQLCLHHELLLLVLDDSKGHFAGNMFQYGVAGAILSELLLQGLIKVSPEDGQTVSVTNTSSSGDPILDEAMQKINESKTPRDLKHWVFQIAQIPKLCHRVAMQLCEIGILSFDESKVLWLFTRRRYPELNGSYEDAIRSRMAEVMFTTDAKSDQRTSVLIAFAKSSGALSANFASVELKQHDARIKEICEGKQLAAGATVEAVAAVQAAIAAATIATTIAVTAATS